MGTPGPQSSLDIAGLFPAQDRESWTAKATADLKGRPLERLTSTLYEGVEVQPLYMRGDGPDPATLGLPGQAPLVRGSRSSQQWDIRQYCDHPDRVQAAQQASDELAGGCSSLTLLWQPSLRLHARHPTIATCSPRGLLVQRLPELAEILAAVHVDWITIHLDAGASTPAAAALLCALYQERGLDLSQQRAALGYDPLALAASAGGLPSTLAAALAQAAELAHWCHQHAPQMRALSASGRAVHEAGATVSQEIATILSHGLCYLRHCEAYGLSVEQAQSQILLECAVGCDQFTEIAKIRALRSLWSRILSACGIAAEAQDCRVHALMGERSQATVDPWVNILRGTVAGFSAAVAGADSITVAPFDQRLGTSDALSRRLARNTQVILAEESHLGRVCDPGGGSWYLESLTKELSDRAWTVFQELEAAGGALAALTTGAMHQDIAALVQQRRSNVSKRRDAITGVSEFPMLGEVPLHRPAPPLTVLVEEYERVATGIARDPQVTQALAAVASAHPGGRMDAAIAAARQGATIHDLMQVLLPGPGECCPALTAIHNGDQFEALRAAVQRHAQHHGAPPSMFMATLGPVARHTLRVGFARNACAAGGFLPLDTSPPEGYGDRQALLAAFVASKAPVACVCGHDDDYALHAADTIAALVQAGAQGVILAGRPAPEWVTAVQQAGLRHAIFLGCSLIPVLEDCLRCAGVDLSATENGVQS